MEVLEESTNKEARRKKLKSLQNKKTEEKDHILLSKLFDNCLLDCLSSVYVLTNVCLLISLSINNSFRNRICISYSTL